MSAILHQWLKNIWRGTESKKNRPLEKARYLFEQLEPRMLLSFTHPGGLLTLTDLDRMKTQVAAGAHPWIDDWNVLITDPLASNTYANHATANMGTSRQICGSRCACRLSEHDTMVYFRRYQLCQPCGDYIKCLVLGCKRGSHWHRHTRPNSAFRSSILPWPVKSCGYIADGLQPTSTGLKP